MKWASLNGKWETEGMEELTCGEGKGAGGAETARRARKEMQTPCQTFGRASVFDPWNGKEPAKTARKLRF
jgi:hypothetical protein